MMKVVYPILKADHPGATIVSGGALDGTPINAWLTAALTDGLASYADVVAYHAYEWYSSGNGMWANPATTVLHDRAQGIRAITDVNSLMMNEGALGVYNTSTTPVTRTVDLSNAQSYYGAVSAAWGLADHLQAVIWWRVELCPASSYCDWATNLQDNGVNNKIGIAWRHTATRLRGLSSATVITSTGVTTFTFDNGSQLIYSSDVQTHTIQVARPAVDVWGNPISGTNVTLSRGAGTLAVWVP